MHSNPTLWYAQQCPWVFEGFHGVRYEVDAIWVDVDDLDKTLHSMSGCFTDHREQAGSFHWSFLRAEDGIELLTSSLLTAGGVISIKVLCDLLLYCELVVVTQYEGGVVAVWFFVKVEISIVWFVGCIFTCKAASFVVSDPTGVVFGGLLYKFCAAY